VAVSTFVGSSEYQLDQTTQWLSQTGAVILGRALTSQEQSTWLSYLLAGGARTTALTAIVNEATFTQQDL
jgi:hypothetical protein